LAETRAELTTPKIPRLSDTNNVMISKVVSNMVTP
jgi:hypothetical protein